MTKCTYDPSEFKNQPIGMFHCPECGEMVLAGMSHPEWDSLEESADKYFDEKYEEMKRYFQKHLGVPTYETLIMFIDCMPNMKGAMLEIWLRAVNSFEEKF